MYTIAHDSEQARNGRDAIVKTAYERVFQWIVNKVADSLDQGPSDMPFVGVLDIFGFEVCVCVWRGIYAGGEGSRLAQVFEKNDFEQLLINFANEKLQLTFNNAVLAAEQKL
jgi:myosin heavy subunit